MYHCAFSTLSLAIIIFFLIFYIYIYYICFYSYTIYTMTTTTQTIETSKWLNYANQPLTKTITTTTSKKTLWSIQLYDEQELTSEDLHKLQQREKQEKILQDFDKDWYETGNIALEHLTLYSFDNIVNKDWQTTSYYNQTQAILDRLYKTKKSTISMPQDSDNNQTLAIEPHKNYMDSKTRKQLIKKLWALKAEKQKLDKQHKSTKRIKEQVEMIRRGDYVLA